MNTSKLTHLISVLILSFFITACPSSKKESASLQGVPFQWKKIDVKKNDDGSETWLGLNKNDGNLWRVVKDTASNEFRGEWKMLEQGARIFDFSWAEDGKIWVLDEANQLRLNQIIDNSPSASDSKKIDGIMKVASNDSGQTVAVGGNNAFFTSPDTTSWVQIAEHVISADISADGNIAVLTSINNRIFTGSADLLKKGNNILKYGSSGDYISDGWSEKKLRAPGFLTNTYQTTTAHEVYAASDKETFTLGKIYNSRSGDDLDPFKFENGRWNFLDTIRSNLRSIFFDSRLNVFGINGDGVVREINNSIVSRPGRLNSSSWRTFAGLPDNSRTLKTGDLVVLEIMNGYSKEAGKYVNEDYGTTSENRRFLGLNDPFDHNGEQLTIPGLVEPGGEEIFVVDVLQQRNSDKFPLSGNGFELLFPDPSITYFSLRSYQTGKYLYFPHKTFDGRRNPITHFLESETNEKLLTMSNKIWIFQMKEKDTEIFQDKLIVLGMDYYYDNLGIQNQDATKYFVAGFDFAFQLEGSEVTRGQSFVGATSNFTYENLNKSSLDLMERSTVWFRFLEY